MQMVFFGIVYTSYVSVSHTDPGYIPTSGHIRSKKKIKEDKKEKEPTAAPMSESTKSAAEDLEMGVISKEEAPDSKPVIHTFAASPEGNDQKDPVLGMTFNELLDEGLLDLICTTCTAIKPPRAKHCRHCNRCVRRFDHHCPWINNCVGENNHISFCVFLFFMGIGTMAYAIQMAQYLDGILADSSTAGGVALKFGLSIPLMIHAFLISLYNLVMFFQQFGIIFNNLTTNESINLGRYQYLWEGDKPNNPYDEGGCGNLVGFCRLKAPNPSDKLPDRLRKVTDLPQLFIDPGLQVVARKKQKASSCGHNHGGQGHGHSHGGRGGAHGGAHGRGAHGGGAHGGQGHSHSHGGKECHGH
jgi:ribosomal protein L40E